MTLARWFQVLRPISPRARLLLGGLSFVLPIVVWSIVSYVPAVWHPQILVTNPGSVDYLQAGMRMDKRAFADAAAEARSERKEPPQGVPSNPIYLPAPHEVAAALYTSFITPPATQDGPWLHQSLWHSIQVIFWGFVISSILGVPIGILCGTYAGFARLNEPFIEFFRYLPAPAFGALAVAILGIYDGPKITIIVIGTFFQQVLIIANTTRKLDVAMVEAALTLGTKKLKLLSRVVIPGILPDLYRDQRILLGWAWTYLIVAELIGTSTGITFFITQQARYQHFATVYAAIMIIGIIGLVHRHGAGARRAAAVPVGPHFGQECVREAPLNKFVPPNTLPSYLDQSAAVRARFARLKEREVILKVDNLSKVFTTGKGSTLALNKINFETHRREFLCVVGPSGCGKSTLVRILAGLEQHTSGDVLLAGKPVTEPGSDRGMVFQGYTLFPWLTVKKNVMFGLEVNGKGHHEAETQALQWLQLIGLEKFAESYPHQLSGGMKQRVAIVRALANQPRILLMDEPFGALDAQTRSKMQAHLLEIWRKIDITIVFITHDLDEAIFLADRILVLSAHPGAGAGADRGAGAAPAQHRAIHFAGIPRHQGAARGIDPRGAVEDEEDGTYQMVARLTDVSDSVD